MRNEIKTITQQCRRVVALVTISAIHVNSIHHDASRYVITVLSLISVS
jgi:hypothetical protein